jgi:hypothetical protein
MITLNGNKFAETENEFLNSLFTLETCSGYAKRLKRKIKIFNIQNELIAVVNRWGVLCCASKLASGKYWYSHATVKEIGEYSLCQKDKDLENLIIKKEATGKDLDYLHQFK